ncbi:MAG: hypothetical protein ACYTFG_20050 [Planctomycetota bacterium]
MNRLAALLFSSLLFLASCGGGPDKKDGGGSGSKDKPTATESWSTAQEKEATGDRVQSFGRIQWLQEAMLEYQWLADNHPRSSRSRDAKGKVERIRSRIDRLEKWKAKADAFDRESKSKMGRPDYLGIAAGEAEALMRAPFSFVKASAKKRLARLQDEADRTVKRAVTALRTKVERAMGKRDWPAAWAAFGSFDPDYGRIFPAYAEEVDLLKNEIEGKSRRDAGEVMAKAEKKAEGGEVYSAVRVVVRARSRFEGLPVQKELKAKERDLRVRANTRIIKERKIESKVKPPKAEPPVPKEIDAPPESEEARAAAAMKYPVVDEKVPAAKKVFEGADDPLAEADRWYYKAVEREKSVLPGDDGYQENLKKTIEMYEKVRELYVHLLEKNKKPDKAIEERLEKIQTALFWCKKSRTMDWD